MVELIANLIPELTKKESELSSKEREALYTALSLTAEFMKKANIIPYIDNLITWYLVFCYLTRQGIKKPPPNMVFKVYDLIPKKIVDVNRLSQALETPKILRALKLKISQIVDEIELIIKETEEKLKKAILKLSGKEKLEYKEIEEIKGILIEAQERITEKLKTLLERLETLSPEIEAISEETPAFCINFKLFQTILKKAISRIKQVETPMCFVAIKIKNILELTENLDKADLLDFLNRFSSLLKGELRTQDLISYHNGVFYVLLQNIELKDAINAANRCLNVLKTLIKEPYFTLGISVVEIHKEDELSQLLARTNKVLAITEALEGDVVRTELDLNVWR
ncbi:MAG: hypothetical protein ACPLSJ_04165 [Thermosulfidibacteraceae bacterium]